MPGWKNSTNPSEQEIPELQFLNRPLPEFNIGDMRPVARQAGLTSTNPEDPENLKRLLTILKLDESHAQRVLPASRVVSAPGA